MTLLFIPDVSTLNIRDMDYHWRHVKDNHIGVQRHNSMGSPGLYAAVVYRGDAVARHNLSLYERLVKRAHAHHTSLSNLKVPAGSTCTGSSNSGDSELLQSLALPVPVPLAVAVTV